MTIESSTLRPGFLVSLKTSVTGNVRYSKRIIDSERIVDGGAAVASWNTQRTIVDPAEHDAAIKARSAARTAITKVCVTSAFGLLCPEAAAEELEAAVAEARKVADEFNKTAKLGKVLVYIITGKIAQDDMEAVKAINSEVSDLLKEMERGVGDGDVETVRTAANKAKAIAEMLSIEARTQAEIAIEAARKAAREIKKAQADGKTVSIDRRAMRTIAESRTMFLDLDDAEEVETPKAKSRQLDLTGEALG